MSTKSLSTEKPRLSVRMLMLFIPALQLARGLGLPHASDAGDFPHRAPEVDIEFDSIEDRKAFLLILKECIRRNRNHYQIPEDAEAIE